MKTETTDKTRAGRWLRVSSGGQDEENQQPSIDAWIEAHGYEVAATYELHGKSAYKGKQDKKLAEVIADMESGKIEVLVVWQSSRIERRGAYNAFELAARVKAAGGRIEYTEDTYLNQANDMSDVMLALAATKDQMESKDKSKRIKAVQARIRSNKGAIGRAPYGFTITGPKYAKRFEVYEPEAKHTREMVKRYLAGDSLTTICADFKTRGITTKTGADWTPKTLGQYLKRHTLYGSRECESGVERVDELIPYDDWARVQLRLASLATKTSGKKPDEYALLSGTLYCPHGHKLYLTNSGYYCRTCPAGDRVLIPQANVETAVTRWVSELSRPETQTVIERGNGHLEEIERLTADIRSLDPTTADYVTQVTAMGTEIQRLKELPDKPNVAHEVPTGKTMGEAFLSRLPIEQRDFLLSNVRAIITTEKHGDFDGWLLQLGIRDEMLVSLLVPRS